MEISRLYDDLCICEAVDVKPQVFERESSLEYQPLERRALDAMEICHTAPNSGCTQSAGEYSMWEVGLTWINVHTQLPGLGEKCLFVVRNEVRCGVIGPSDNGFRIYDGSEFDDAPLIVEVSHWMYLPEPPTSEKAESPSDSPASPVQQRHAAGAEAKPCPHTNVDFPKVGTEHIKICRDCGEYVEDTDSA